jgi:hypothetical protein
MDQLEAVRLKPTAGCARASELLALSNKALDQVAELLDHHILVPRSVHLLPYAASRSSAKWTSQCSTYAYGWLKTTSAWSGSGRISK